MYKHLLIGFDRGGRSASAYEENMRVLAIKFDRVYLNDCIERRVCVDGGMAQIHRRLSLMFQSYCGRQ